MSTENPTKDAAVAEATEVEMVEFEYDGEKYRVERDCMDDAVVYEAIETDRYASMVKHILGPAQWRLFNLKRRRAADLLSVADVIAKVVTDGSLGESKG